MMKGATKLELARHAGHDTRRVGVLGGRPGTRRLLGSDGTGRGDRTRGRRRWSSGLGQVIFQERAHGRRAARAREETRRGSRRDPLRVRPGQDGTA